MPTFNFRCTKCASEFSGKIPFGSKEYPPCPKCKGTTEKLLTPPLGIMFRGSGFYKTDSVKSPPVKPAETKPAEKKVETPAPSKPAAESGTTSKPEKK